MTEAADLGAERDDDGLGTRRVGPRVDVKGPGEVVEVHHLLDDPRGQVVVEPHHLSGEDRDHAVGRFRGQSLPNGVESRRELLDDGVPPTLSDLGAAGANGCVVVVGEGIADLREVLRRRLEVEGPVGRLGVQVVADDPDAAPGEVARERADGLGGEDRLAVPRVGHA
ncbi:MAG: hypothetical protein MUP67_05490 [Acidimicrobiia bacterium]|nr:hypothetical protein [Acidimicrobiia bacterium]